MQRRNTISVAPSLTIQWHPLSKPYVTVTRCGTSSSGDSVQAAEHLDLLSPPPICTSSTQPACRPPKHVRVLVFNSFSSPAANPSEAGICCRQPISLPDAQAALRLRIDTIELSCSNLSTLTPASSRGDPRRAAQKQVPAPPPARRPRLAAHFLDIEMFENHSIVVVTHYC